MAYKIVWSAEAENDFLSIFNYLKENWSILSAQKFAEHTFKRLDKIAATNYYKPRSTSKSAIQIIKLDKKNVLFFTIDQDFMVLLSIYPYKKDITKSKYY